MADTDEEQFETIKKWWEENGKSILVGVVVALVAVFGYQAWQSNVQAKGEAASAIFEDMMEAFYRDSPFETLDPEKAATGRFLANRLKEEHAGTTYAQFAAMFIAKLALDDGDLALAEQELNWAIKDGLSESLEPITRIRLARVKLEQGEPEQALQTISTVDAVAYRASLEEVRGDIHHALGHFDLARESYQLALNALEEDDVRPFLQMKLDDLIAPKATLPADEAPAEAPAEAPTADGAG